MWQLKIYRLPALSWLYLDGPQETLHWSSFFMCPSVCKLLPRWIPEKESWTLRLSSPVILKRTSRRYFPSEFEVWNNMRRFSLYTDTPENFRIAFRVCHKSTMSIIFCYALKWCYPPSDSMHCWALFFEHEITKIYLRSNMKEDGL